MSIYTSSITKTNLSWINCHRRLILAIVYIVKSMHIICHHSWRTDVSQSAWKRSILLVMTMHAKYTMVGIMLRIMSVKALKMLWNGWKIKRGLMYRPTSLIVTYSNLFKPIFSTLRKQEPNFLNISIGSNHCRGSHVSPKIQSNYYKMEFFISMVETSFSALV